MKMDTQEYEKENEVAKLVIKSHAFLLDPNIARNVVKVLIAYVNKNAS